MLKLIINELINLRGIKKPHAFLRKQGLSNHKISEYQSGKAKSFKIKDIEHLCKVFICTPNDLFSWDPDINSKLPDEHPLNKLKKQASINLAEITTDMSLEELAEFSQKVVEIKTEIKKDK